MLPLITQPSIMMTFPEGQRPGHYGDSSREYACLTQQAGYIEDVSSEWLVARGSDTASMLQGMLTQNVIGIPQGGAAPSFALDAQGKILTMLHLYRQDKTTFVIGCPPGQAAPLKRHLERFVIMEDVQFSRQSGWMCIAVAGPEATTNFGENVASRVQGYSRSRANLPGFDFILPQKDAAKLVAELRALGRLPIGWQALNCARIEAGEPWFPQDILPETNPVIYQVQDAISSTKGCYIGQETVAMTRDRGRPPYVLATIQSQDAATSPAEISLVVEGKTVGHSHSHCYSAKFAAFMRLASVKFKVFADGLTHVFDETGHRWQITQYHYKAKS